VNHDPTAVAYPVPDGASVGLLRSNQIPGAVELFEAQLREHAIDTGTDKIESVVRQILADPRLGFILGASVTGKLQGIALCSSFLGVEHGGPSGWLEELYVHPSCRQLGLGSKLLQAAINEAKKRDWQALELEVEADHQRVVGLYARHGFQPRTRSRFYLKMGSDC